MGRPSRLPDEDQLYCVTNVCIQQAYLFWPTEEVNRIIRGCIAHAMLYHPVRVFHFCLILNRFAMIVQAPEYNLPRFMQRLQSRIARKLNKLYERKGKFFEGRYKKADL